jgi:amino acid permease
MTYDKTAIAPNNFRYLAGFPVKIVAIATTMSLWVPASQISPALWISLFGALPIMFNFFNVRKYGEIEFWFTTTKAWTIYGIIILGLLLPMGASTAGPVLGYDQQSHQIIPCQNVTTDDCVSAPGFICTLPSH